MSFNPDKETGTKINYKNITEVVKKVFDKKYTAYEWTSKGNFSKIEKETEIEPGLAAHEMIERLMEPTTKTQTFYGVNTRMLTMNQRNTYIEEQANKLKQKAEEYKQAAEEAAKQAAEEAAKQAAEEAKIPEPTETKGE